MKKEFRLPEYPPGGGHKEQPMPSKRFEEGLVVRRAVLGDAHVDRSLAGADELTYPLQEMITEMAWGTVWSRPGLPRKIRSLINIAMLTALNREHEFALHVRAALRNGCTRAEIAEVLMQTAIYCGVPAALDSSRVAKRIFAEIDAEAQANGGAKPAG